MIPSFLCRLKTDDEGIAYNSFWVTDRAGLQLKKAAADLTAERMGDFLVYCTPSRKVWTLVADQSGPQLGCGADKQRLMDADFISTF